MPLRDGTGPMGNGPVGRRLGPCGGGNTSTPRGSGLNRGMRRGWAKGQGQGRGMGRGGWKNSTF